MWGSRHHSGHQACYEASTAGCSQVALGVGGTNLACGLQGLLQGLQLGWGHPGMQVEQKSQHMPVHVLLPGKGHARLGLGY